MAFGALRVREWSSDAPPQAKLRKRPLTQRERRRRALALGRGIATKYWPSFHGYCDSHQNMMAIGRISLVIATNLCPRTYLKGSQ